MTKLKPESRESGAALAGSFRQLLLAEMKRQGIDMENLAGLYGCTIQNLAQIFDGGPGLRFDTAEKLCRALNCRLVLQIELQS